MVVVHWIRHGQSTCNKGQSDYMEALAKKDPDEIDDDGGPEAIYRVMDRYPGESLKATSLRPIHATPSLSSPNPNLHL